MVLRGSALAVLLVVALAACSSDDDSPDTAAGSSSSSVAPTTTTTVPGVEMHFRVTAPTPSFEPNICREDDLCVLRGSERGTVTGDLEGMTIVGTSFALNDKARVAISRTDVFRGTVEGCGAGTLVLLGTEYADLDSGEGSWEIAEGFGTGELAKVTGHGTASGTAGAEGIDSQWEGVIDCGK
jgi:hypothetical protein